MTTTFKHALYLIAGYIVVSAVIYFIFNQFGVPFTKSQPMNAHTSGSQLFWHFQQTALWIFIEIMVVILITMGYKDRTMQSPGKHSSKVEIFMLLGYMVFVQLLGVALGRLIGFHALSFHIAGSMYGTYDHVPLTEMFTWSIYNFVMYVVLPLIYFTRSKGYNLRQLNVISTKNVVRDLIVIIVILTLESTAQLLGMSHAIFDLSLRQLMLGGIVTFLFNMFGTCLPTSIFIFAILYPRYKTVTNSPILPILFGGLTYMFAHFFESWMMFNSLHVFLASLGALFLQYFLPGLVKSVLTERTGNPWVHLWAYHAIAPHVLMDTPHFVHQLDIKK